MKELFTKLFSLFLFSAIIIASILFLLPPSKTTEKRLVFSLIEKNKQLMNIGTPRIIFIGGSNLSFGLDSKRIRDSLKINPINTGIHADLGLKFMLTNAENYIKKNDIIVISPEYQQFYGNLANGSTELLSTILDVSPNSIKLLDHKQYYSLLKAIPKYSISKLYGYLEFSNSGTKNGAYERGAFNAFGDAFKHWSLPGERVAPYGKMDGDINEDAILALLKFINVAHQKNAEVYLAFPGYQESSFKYSATQIKEVEQYLVRKGFKLLSKPERYIIPDSLIFDTPYHLTKEGVDRRTALLIEDLMKVI